MTEPIAWIEAVEENDATGELTELYERGRDPRSGVVDNILSVRSLHPETLADHLQLYTTIMHRRRAPVLSSVRSGGSP